ncbi:hypothetical protein AWC38_SpisGene22169 [Stylophora pistillata]|uniref:C-type lectin domain-containing protein n=1 Tax=Stylophora pistillata TaxID=50429 RepID=A0A2B4RBW3_STYPI|nr:hypothetical protein AWC38_SpisGene22169 [Stylophora pistillata]
MRDKITLPYRSPSDHLHDRVTCTYEVPPSSEMQSIDPVHIQETQSSTELTVHLTLSQTESRLATHETRSDCKEESEYNDMDETNGNLRSGSEGCSEIQEREREREKATMISGKKEIDQPPTLCGEKEENKDNVYAVVHKERKDKVNSEASALKTFPGRPQEGASGFPVYKASGVDCTGRSSHQTDLGFDNITKTAESETPQAGGNNEYLYAAVDMTTKKKKPPQMPPPYRGLVYADLAHTRENSAKLVQEQSQTVYAQIDHVKTARVKISQQNLEETDEGELNAHKESCRRRHPAEVKICSNYSIYEDEGNWYEAMERCGHKDSGSLVSMETEREWHFVKNLTKERKQRKDRWFIGLKIVNGSHTWKWLSNSTPWVNGTSTRIWRWEGNEPNNLNTEE